MQDRTAATWEQASPRLSPYGAGSHYDHELHVAGMRGMVAVSEHHGHCICTANHFGYTCSINHIS